MSSDDESGGISCQKSGAARQIDKRGQSGYGECRVTSLHNAHGGLERLRIDQADPRVLIARELLEQMAPPDPVWRLPATFDGEIVRIRGENRSVIYRVVRYLPELECFEAEFPD